MKLMRGLLSVISSSEPMIGHAEQFILPLFVFHRYKDGHAAKHGAWAQRIAYGHTASFAFPAFWRTKQIEGSDASWGVYLTKASSWFYDRCLLQYGCSVCVCMRAPILVLRSFYSSHKLWVLHGIILSLVFCSVFHQYYFYNVVCAFPKFLSRNKQL